MHRASVAMVNNLATDFNTLFSRLFDKSVMIARNDSQPLDILGVDAMGSSEGPSVSDQWGTTKWEAWAAFPPKTKDPGILAGFHDLSINDFGRCW